MNWDAPRASVERVATYFSRIDAPGATIYDAVEALVSLKDEDLAYIGKTRAQMVAELLERFPTGVDR